jgi:hypothetical protein
MAQCEVCGNNYDKSFQVTQGGRTHTFDSFECAITSSRRRARIVTAGLSDTASNRTARSTAARIAPNSRVCAGWTIACEFRSRRSERARQLPGSVLR